MNWGHKLTIAIISFVTFMAFMVYKCYTTEFQLVEKEYYKSELKYQQVIDGAQRADQLIGRLTITKQGDKVFIRLPEDMKDKTISGTMWFYCAYEAGMDKKVQLKTDADGLQVLDATKFTPGTYTVKVEWSSDNQNYYREQKLII